jgi:hypothetical protein
MAQKTHTAEARLQAAKDRHNPPKAETPKVTTLPATPPAAKPEDQKSVPAVQGEVQKTETPKDETKAKKKASGTVARWKALIANKAFADGKGVITITAKGKGDKPKRNKGTSKFGALDRFRLYKDGMTVGDYCKASKEGGYTLAGAMQDVRWDVAQGLIEVK